MFFSVSANLKRKIFKSGGHSQSPMFASLYRSDHFLFRRCWICPNVCQFISLIWSNWTLNRLTEGRRHQILNFSKVLLSLPCQSNSFKPVVFHSFSLKWLTNFITKDFDHNQTVESLWSPDLFVYKMRQVCQDLTFS